MDTVLDRFDGVGLRKLSDPDNLCTDIGELENGSQYYLEISRPREFGAEDIGKMEGVINGVLSKPSYFL